MSREIKFRAWDNRYKEYLKNVMIDSYGKVYFDDGVATQDELDIHIEQSTGLKDANDNPIYEGDIVKYTAEDGDSFLAPVKYFAADGYPAFDIPTAFIPYWHFESNVLSAGMAENSIEVVGNIHDSPELLEAEK
ncbi:YopX family protein [Lentilactobacillus parabuchneri]|uniref:YopX family protein n=1 Tax=Lentilactobacillus parabuchneri TaxID=152331 RepID=UPI0031CF8E56